MKHGLGQGFEGLIPTDLSAEDFTSLATDGADFREIPIDHIAPDPTQPRRNFDEESLNQLAASIREHGILQPLIVVPIAKNHSAVSDKVKAPDPFIESVEEDLSRKTDLAARFQIVAGERRWRAAKIAKLKKVSVIVRTLDEQHKLELMLIENVQRADLNPLETAVAFAKLKTDFNLTDAAIAARVGKAPSTISNQLRLLNLPDFAKESLVVGEISEGHARQVLALDSAADQKTLVAKIAHENWNVRDAEKFVLRRRNVAQSRKTTSQKPFTKPILTPADEKVFRERLAAKFGLSEKNVRLKPSGAKLKLTVEFANETELKNFREKFAK